MLEGITQEKPYFPNFHFKKLAYSSQGSHTGQLKTSATDLQKTARWVNVISIKLHQVY